MPEVSRFYGIVIMMYYNDHDPPHFHARYQDDKDWELARNRKPLEPIPPLR